MATIFPLADSAIKIRSLCPRCYRKYQTAARLLIPKVKIFDPRTRRVSKDFLDKPRPFRSKYRRPLQLYRQDKLSINDSEVDEISNHDDVLKSLASSRRNSDETVMDPSEYESRKSAHLEKLFKEARDLTKNWKRSESSDGPRCDPTQPLRMEREGVIPITTSLIVHVPPAILNDRERGIDQARILRNMFVLLLRRSPDARPHPNEWGAVTGKMEQNENGSFETPILSALREIREETGTDMLNLQLKGLLSPGIERVGWRRYQTWAMLWNMELPEEVTKLQKLDKRGDLLDTRSRSLTARYLNNIIELNDEHVDSKWDLWWRMSRLENTVPYVVGTTRGLVQSWVSNSEATFPNETLKKAYSSEEPETTTLLEDDIKNLERSKHKADEPSIASSL